MAINLSFNSLADKIGLFWIALRIFGLVLTPFLALFA
jgi:hypothetical protein